MKEIDFELVIYTLLVFGLGLLIGAII